MSSFDASSKTAAVAPSEMLPLDLGTTRAVLVVDRLVGGTAGGGIRFTPALDTFELAHLARVMTLKYAFVDLPLGGAKTAILGDRPAEAAARRRLLTALGAALRPHRGRYFPGKDVGFLDTDLHDVMAAMGLRRGKAVDSAAHTASTVTLAAREWLAATGRTLTGSRVAIEGFGAVGTAAARILAAAGCSIVAVSTSRGAVARPAGLDVDRLLAARRGDGEGFVETYSGGCLAPPDLLAIDCDLLLPCGPSWTLHAGSAEHLKAGVVVPGANCPATDEARRRLAERGITLLPDFVCNCGGVVGSALERLGATPAEAASVIRTELAGRFRALSAPSTDGSTIRERAMAIASRNLERRAGSRSSTMVAARARILTLARRGLLPTSLTRAIGIPAVRRLVRRGHRPLESSGS